MAEQGTAEYWMADRRGVGRLQFFGMWVIAYVASALGTLGYAISVVLVAILAVYSYINLYGRPYRDPPDDSILGRLMAVISILMFIANIADMYVTLVRTPVWGLVSLCVGAVAIGLLYVLHRTDIEGAIQLARELDQGAEPRGHENR